MSFNIQWFPGHMARARRVLSENLSIVDIVVEMIDARIPYSSRNPEIDKILGVKKRVIVANKKDLADADVSAYWKSYYTNKEIPVIFVDCKSGKGVNDVSSAIKLAMQEKHDRVMARGRLAPVIKAMIVGIPNVGKSSFINKVAGRNVAVTGDKPGVTRNKQWLMMNKDISLLDTPGLLWPKFDDMKCGFKLACVGSIKDDILDIEDICAYLLWYLYCHYTGILQSICKNTDSLFTEYNNNSKINSSSYDEETRNFGLRLLSLYAQSRGFLLKGGILDVNRASHMLLDDFRSGKLGRISLDSKGEVYSSD